MPLNAGATGYGSVTGSVAGPGLSASGAGGSESAPLLIPEPEPAPYQRWQPLTKEELELAAGGPHWKKARCYLLLLFWLAWVAMISGAIAVLMTSPRPVAMTLEWWQKTLFYRLQPELLAGKRAGGSEGVTALCEQLPSLRALGIGALILEGLFDEKASSLNLNVTGDRFGTLPQIQRLLIESHRADLKVVLDVCEVDLSGPRDVADDTFPQHALRFWLEQGVAGFVICDTDAAYSGKTLLEWKGVFKEFGSEEMKRIVVVKQTRDVLPPLDQGNVTLVDVVMRSILPFSQYLLSTKEVAVAIETRLQTSGEDLWPSWTVGGEASLELKELLLVLLMTLPGSPAVRYDEDLNQAQDKERSVAALFSTLADSRAQEEALLFGSFTFLPFNSSSNSSSSSSSSSSNSTLPPPPILAFLRSWGCVHFLVLLNVGPEPGGLDAARAPGLPTAGVFVANSRMDRVGSTTLDTLVLRPREAAVVKLFEPGSYS
ncbi:4F2 cell-surface antigen heavy chain [Liparis tanakae]|uniref:4F2 cell-surface antigen heavy chain n=1 Tax=Liparis tanakae TaxID=230148 RepID=A0A4Z2GNB9_9TELE|nr:4F2 cell-surface antigen heavy chain [Liparis tanakae]